MDKNIKSYKDSTQMSDYDSESNTNRPSNSNAIGDSYRNDVNNTSSNRHRNSRFSTIFNHNVFYILFCIIVLCFGFACREEFLLNKLNKETMTNFESQVNTLREEILRLNKVLNSLQPVADTMPNFALESQVNTLSEEILRLNKFLNSLQPVADTMPNFALRSQEARVLLDRSSQTYSKKGGCAYLFGIFCKRPVHPRTVLQLIFKGRKQQEAQPLQEERKMNLSLML
ncbi:hypothetical protein CgunFtcFv8_019633 [Champsocephalus gunnari]|uniref:Uncharacterized protein n=1 Tax=Champsocephalus gunnari TaxID=52237 RepID=A0AAN8DFT9_CHAGU|nr:hypothetical protein CgunFtcFv8_019633 [Champsocephalus gunnari]